MRGCMSDFEFANPKTLSEALALLSESPEKWMPIAGGTDIMVVYAAGKLQHKSLINIFGLGELKEIVINSEKSELKIGAGCTYSQILKNKTIQEFFPNICAAALETGAPAIQNRGTLGGNIVNASPAADSPTALLCYDAQLELVSAQGSRIVALNEFYKSYKKFDLKPGELLKNIILPFSQKLNTHLYRKVGTRRAQSIAKLGCALTAHNTGQKLENVRFAISALTPTISRLKNTEKILESNSIDQIKMSDLLTSISSAIAPIDDIRSNANYRRDVILNISAHFFTALGVLNV